MEVKSTCLLMFPKWPDILKSKIAGAVLTNMETTYGRGEIGEVSLNRKSWGGLQLWWIFHKEAIWMPWCFQLHRRWDKTPEIIIKAYAVKPTNFLSASDLSREPMKGGSRRKQTLTKMPNYACSRRIASADVVHSKFQLGTYRIHKFFKEV